MTIHYIPRDGYENPMKFCANRLNAKAANAIIQQNPQGLSNTAALDTALKVGDYTSVLKCIWSERNREVRLTWLRENTYKFHPIIPFERAMAVTLPQSLVHC